MRRTAVLVSSLALAALAPLGTPAAHAAGTTPAAPVTFGSEILRLTNVARAHHHLAPLKPAICADRFAATWTRALAAARNLSHQSLGPIMVSCHASMAAENVAYGNLTPAQFVTMWINSPGHRENMLNPSYTHMGVAAVRTMSDLRVYATEDFVRVS
jgi:uncharacterized protein YkwD